MVLYKSELTDLVEEKDTYDTVSPKNLEKLLKVKSPKARAGHVKIFSQKLDEKKIIENSENWNPSHFKPFVTHSPDDYMNKEKTLIKKKW